MNNITLRGYIVGETEIKAPNGGATIAKFTLSVRDPFLKDKEDNIRKHTSFLDCEYWPKDDGKGNVQKEIAKLIKGNLVCFDARPVQDRWKTEDGSVRSKVKFIVDGFINEMKHINNNNSQSIPNTDEEDSPF